MSIYDYQWEYRPEERRSKKEAVFDLVVTALALGLMAWSIWLLLAAKEGQDIAENQDFDGGQAVLTVYQEEGQLDVQEVR